MKIKIKNILKILKLVWFGISITFVFVVIRLLLKALFLFYFQPTEEIVFYEPNKAVSVLEIIFTINGIIFLLWIIIKVILQTIHKTIFGDHIEEIKL
jgi:hypothetical protein